MSQLQIPSRDVIEALCKTDGPESKGLAYNDRIWIKYGTYVTLAEAAFQRYVYDNADPRIVRIARVFDAFRTTPPNARPMTYIIMENVKGDDYATYSKQHPQAAKELLEPIANAVRHIWNIPLPRNASIGPFERQEPVDRFFSDCGSGRIFNNLMELEDWINNNLKGTTRIEPHCKESHSFYAIAISPSSTLRLVSQLPFSTGASLASILSLLRSLPLFTNSTVKAENLRKLYTRSFLDQKSPNLCEHYVSHQDFTHGAASEVTDVLSAYLKSTHDT